MSVVPIISFIVIVPVIVPTPWLVIVAPIITIVPMNPPISDAEVVPVTDHLKLVIFDF